MDADVVVVGSGAGGMLAAIRAHDLGLRALVVEKAGCYGGTTAISGGQLWIPAHPLMAEGDSESQGADYIHALTQGAVPEDRIAGYLENGPKLVRYLEELGVRLEAVAGFPDYSPWLRGAHHSRAIAPLPVDAAGLGMVEFGRLLEPSSLWKVAGRYLLETRQLGIFATRPRGWQREFLKMLMRYWLDVPWRLRTRRDRQRTLGNALVAALREAMIARKIPLLLNTPLLELDASAGAVRGVIVSHGNQRLRIEARRAVILACGGFEHNQSLRDQFHRIRTSTSASLAPNTNTGDGILAGVSVGADLQFMEHGWWVPVMRLPSPSAPHLARPHLVFRNAHSLIVNRHGKRFVNEAASYDQIGAAMIADHGRAGGEPFCWMIFDRTFRQRYTCGGLLPSIAMPDRRVPRSAWGRHVFRGDSIEDLASQVSLDRSALRQSIQRLNSAAARGVDPDFGRGSNAFDRATAGDPRVHPNPCLGAVATPPFYAVRMELGDIGTKGGLKIDRHGQVLDKGGAAIAGLYAAGNVSACVFAGSYPGAGATLGPALTIAYCAANHIAVQAGASLQSRATAAPPAGSPVAA